MGVLERLPFIACPRNGTATRLRNNPGQRQLPEGNIVPVGDGLKRAESRLNPGVQRLLKQAVGASMITALEAVIRAELPPLLRLSCIHEEMAQGLGLANDSTARPSIFNDDDEFARLTGMDEKMLLMLYDIRLKPGMDEETAMPIVNELARSLTAPAL